MIALCVLLGNLHIRRLTFLHATLNSSTDLHFCPRYLLIYNSQDSSHALKLKPFPHLNILGTFVSNFMLKHNNFFLEGLKVIL